MTSRPAFPALRTAAGMLVMLASFGTRARSQTVTSMGRISGSVVDVTTSAPIRGAVVTLTAQGAFLVTPAREPSPGFVLERSSATTDSGRYAFANLPPGSYRLFVRRSGYAPATIDVALGDGDASLLSIGLVVTPVQLRPLVVRAAGHASTDGGASIDYRSTGRVEAARQRQEDFLSSDVRELTPSDVAEAATYGSMDLLRAMQRLPGVLPADDWSAKTWIRSNRWDDNRIYFDDLPLFDPLQAGGRGAGISTDAIGAALLFPGVRPVSTGGEGATRIELRSRRAGGTRGWRGTTELSAFGGSVELERAREDGSAGFTVSGHHSLDDWLRANPWPGNDPSGVTTDAEIVARGDLRIDPTQSLEGSALISRDARVMRDARTDAQSWSNIAARATWRRIVGRFLVSHTLGGTHFETAAGRLFSATTDAGRASAVTEIPVHSTVDHLSWSGRVESATNSGRGARGGYELSLERAAFRGPMQSLYWANLSPSVVGRSSSVPMLAVWSEGRQTIARWTTREGIRLDAGASSGIPTLRPTASIESRVTLTPTMSWSSAVSRTNQYVQGLDLPNISQGKPTPTLWLAAGPDVPVMTVDNATTGIERWLDGSTLIALNAYARATRGTVLPDPAPGALVDRPLFVAGRETAKGVELSARKLAGLATGSISYSYGGAQTIASGLSFPSSSRRTHALDISGMVAAGALRASAALSVASGAPFTRTLVTPVFAHEAPNAANAPMYETLDLWLGYGRAFGSASLSMFVGAQNALGRRNFTWYQYTETCKPSGLPGATCIPRDVFQSPVGFTPFLGLRASF